MASINSERSIELVDRPPLHQSQIIYISKIIKQPFFLWRLIELKLLNYFRADLQFSTKIYIYPGDKSTTKLIFGVLLT